MCMYEVHLVDGRRLVVYKHVSTRRSLHLDDDSRAYSYGHRGDYGMYHEVSAASALVGVFSGWADLADRPSDAELELAIALIHVVRAGEEPETHDVL
jgi:hypothetical protein